MTRIDPDKVGDFVLVTVRDPLIAYAGDPTAHIGQYLEGAELIGESGMFTSISGTYEGAKITVVSGGSGSSEAELLLYDFMEFSKAHTYLRVGGSGGIGTDVKPGDIVVSLRCSARGRHDPRLCRSCLPGHQPLRSGGRHGAGSR
jgi:uridine phosphorylase